MTESNKLRQQEIEWISKKLQDILCSTSDVLRSQAGLISTASLGKVTQALKCLDTVLNEQCIGHANRIRLQNMLIQGRRFLLRKRDLQGQAVAGVEDEITVINKFLEHLSAIDWEALGLPDEPYDPTKPWRDFQLSEEQMAVAMIVDGVWATYATEYGALGTGQLEITTANNEDKKLPASYVLRITRICLAPQIDGTTAKLFEGEILLEDGKTSNLEDTGAFGFLMPDNNVILTPHSPTSDQAYRNICAGYMLPAGDDDGSEEYARWLRKATHVLLGL